MISDDRIDPGRRAFLRGRYLTADGRRELERRSRPLGPPCPALPTGFADPTACRDCDAPCIPACEPDIVRRHPDDHALAGLAYLDFAAAGCTFCADCVEACPLDRQGAPLPTSLGLAILERDACMAWDGVICISCRLACHDQAIVMDSRQRPAVIVEACTGCGLCVGVCPSLALRVDLEVGAQSSAGEPLAPGGSRATERPTIVGAARQTTARV